jgi:hypothetical protein
MTIDQSGLGRNVDTIMVEKTRMKRRHLLGSMLGGAAAIACPAFAFAQSAAPSLNLLVAGPDGGQTSRWGNACALALGAALPGTPNILAQCVGGLDGVTGANQLDALVVPDGKTAAILPSMALIAYLTGDSRVHFDPTRWVPLLTGVNSGVLMLRATKPAPDVATLRAAPPLRLAADQPQSRDLAALLGLARLGINTAPVFGLRDTDAKTRAFVDGEVDAVFLCGEGVPEDIAPLTAAGAVPFFNIGALGGDASNGGIGPDNVLPGLVDARSLGPAVTPALDAAYLAAAAAAQLDFMLVLPKMTDPGAAGAWTEAAMQAASSPALTAAASASSITLQPAPVLGSALAALAITPQAQSGMLAYLAKNCGWQPS